MQTRITSHSTGLSVADVMDHEPVAVPSETRLDRALDEFFLRYRWQWFPVIDRAGRFLGLVLRENVDEVPEDQRHDRTVDEVVTRDAAGSLRVPVRTRPWRCCWAPRASARWERSWPSTRRACCAEW